MKKLVSLVFLIIAVNVVWAKQSDNPSKNTKTKSPIDSILEQVELIPILIPVRKTIASI